MPKDAWKFQNTRGPSQSNIIYKTADFAYKHLVSLIQEPHISATEYQQDYQLTTLNVKLLMIMN
uniref:Uncharacterized protein n=1 Tax=Megaselia scalaris TaxID=36166 RepID=T1GF72_MEGSC